MSNQKEKKIHEIKVGTEEKRASSEEKARNNSERKIREISKNFECLLRMGMKDPSGVALRM